MKHIALASLFSLLVATLVSTPVIATGSDYVVTPVPNAIVYPSHFDVVGLDVTVGGQYVGDVLTDLTIKNLGTADALHGLKGVRLYIDRAAAGFQGLGLDYDRGLGTAVGTNSWYWSKLNIAVPNGGLGLFVTVETESTVTTNATTQLQIPALSDIDSDGLFDVGDQGLFVASKADGPVGVTLTNSSSQAFYFTTVDIFAPKVVIDNPQEGSTKQSSLVLVEGETRDQGNSSLGLIEISIDGGPWQVVADVSINRQHWTNHLVNTTTGTRTMQARARDSAGNLGYSSLVTFSVEAPPPPAPAPTPLLPDGWLVQADGPNVYVITDRTRRLIPSEALFLGLGYRWDNIRHVSYDELVTMPKGKDLTVDYVHPNGTLVKYASYPAVFLLDGGNRRWVINEATFLAHGYRWSDIITIPETEYYPDGSNITS